MERGRDRVHVWGHSVALLDGIDIVMLSTFVRTKGGEVGKQQNWVSGPEKADVKERY